MKSVCSSHLLFPECLLYLTWETSGSVLFCQAMHKDPSFNKKIKPSHINMVNYTKFDILFFFLPFPLCSLQNIKYQLLLALHWRNWTSFNNMFVVTPHEYRSTIVSAYRIPLQYIPVNRHLWLLENQIPVIKCLITKSNISTSQMETQKGSTLF